MVTSFLIFKHNFIISFWKFCISNLGVRGGANVFLGSHISDLEIVQN